MRRIEKDREPSCLADLRSTPGADWSSVHGTQKQQMREYAFKEQRGLCAYCMSRLSEPPSDKGMKIEHFDARALSPERVFDWGNLLGVCMGGLGIHGDPGEGGGDHRARYHCDTYRGYIPRKEEQRLGLNPAAFPPDVSSMFSYTNQGEMRPAHGLEPTMRASAEAQIDRLNLNIRRLQRNREAVIGALRSEFRRKPPKVARVKELLKHWSTPDGTGLLPPHCQAAVYYLEKKLRQLG
ncbi:MULTISPECIES: retron system putative HNH endonuclease [Sorangium]|uniref:TIGR02646 family protein n=1 Tax=Sorangium cellulosum TaxID=56 RepID=A0A4P2R4S7_SORCE|nr:MULTISPECIES: retron system putative HNH endonuclease [Sorangium]AUX37758.1 hypothetical protein SOCE836_099900 [Sorangium cellulosum]WCQ97047.1 hypothetical protein NQZ70_09838 [Sorangium sp. Soce836]